MDNGYAQLRRGIKEHLSSGRLYFPDFSTYTVLLIDTDPATGIVWSSAARLADVYKQTNQWVRESLERLESSGYIKRFTKRYSPKPYPILINRFLVVFGPKSGYYLDAFNTTDYKNPLYILPEVVPKSSRSRPEVSTSPNIGREIEIEIENKPRTQTSRARPGLPGTATPKTNTEQRRRVAMRDKRLEREALVAAELRVGAHRENTIVIPAPKQLARAAVACATSDEIPAPKEFLDTLREVNRKLRMP